MEEHITPYRIANAAQMNDRYEGYYLFVEGINDKKLFDKFILKENIKSISCNGKSKVLEVVKRLTDEKFSRFVAIIDSDFDKIRQIEHGFQQIFTTDLHDLESMYYNSDAFDNVCFNYISESKILSFKQKFGYDILKKLLELAKQIGHLKFINCEKDISLTFKTYDNEVKTINYSKFITIEGNKIDFKGKEQLVKAVYDFSNGKSKPRFSISETLNLLNSTTVDTMPIYHIVNGHDLSNLFYLFLKKYFKSDDKSLTSFESIEKSLRLAYDYDFFKETDLYKQTLNFSKSNSFILWR